MNFCGRWLLLLLAISVTLGCSEKKSTNEIDDRTSPTYQGPAEEAYCSTASAVASPVTITGTAKFQWRQTFGNLIVGGLGAIENTTKPIRRAEVRAKNEAGTVVQCGETDSSGSFSLDLPGNTGTYTIEVNSRAFNDYAKASVLNKPEFNQFYTITTTVASDSSTSVGTMTAPATASANVIAGAFNILDQIVEANTYLKTYAGTGTCASMGCTEINVAPKVNAYWVAGFNPGSYVGTSGGLSFYLPNYARLFILGGINGNTTEADTDHFDNSIILHEFGHFLEDQVFKSNSPGGSHDGQSVIDPRLAWSEGWGNFFQAAVRNSADYVDSQGNTDGSTSLIFNANIEDNTNNTYDDPKPGGSDLSKGYGTNGEGNFREFSVSRVLWDSIDSANDSESITGGFSELWSVVTNQSWGWLASKWKFRSLGLFHKLQSEMGGSATDWSSIRALERQVNSRREYAQYITPDASCADANYFVTIDPDSAVSGSPNTDYFENYDFYHLSLTSAFTGTFLLEYSDSNGAGTKIDLDIRILDKDGRINNSSDIVAQNIDDNASSSPSVAESTSISNLSLPAGDYLIQIFSWNGTGTPAQYNMKLNNIKLCLKDP